jgi:hypothetical protein
LSLEVLDCLDGLVHLERRSPTLDGAVPVRVARGCVPLLEGNAYGLQVRLSRPLRLRRRLGGWQASFEDADARLLERLHRGALPRLAVEGLLPSADWRRALARGVVHSTRHGLRLFTGLLLTPEAGTWIRVTAAANRRNTQFEVTEQVIPDDGGAPVPLVIELRLRRGAPDRLRIEGEVACVAPLRPGVRFRSCALDQASEVGRAHAAFYDRRYFEDKKEDVTGKYRRLVAAEGAPAPEGDAVARVVGVGAPQFEIEALDRFTTARGPAPELRRREGPRLESVVFRNEVGFSALYDGHTLALEYDKERLRRKAASVERAYQDAVGEPARDHPGAGLYLSKYFTPHPPGEPHFFVKPWAFTETPAGWSSLLDGFHGDGYDVMRGVVSTDVFFATPAVFRVHREGRPVRVPEGQPLLRVIPVPRSLLQAGFRLCRLDA